MAQHYSDPERASDPHALPDLETFYVSDKEASENALRARQDGDDPDFMPETEAGWYWQACFPGCLPDSDPVGPFASEDEALADAREGVE